jgi:DNA-binding NtrC family response regulator
MRDRKPQRVPVIGDIEYGTPVASCQFVTRDPAVLEILEVIKQVANTNATVLIVGETGTGKELIAKILHENSARHSKPLVAVNCGAVAESLQESELFGHVRGAFTGATTRKIGRFEAAHGGTIFLDEVSEMTKAMQVKLLRILQSGEFAPVGMTENQFCDVRVVAATNEDPLPLIDAGAFRKDLYYRLNIIRIELPALRQRKCDVPLLTAHFLQTFGTMYDKPNLTITPEVSATLAQYDYPGNVRELENIVQRAVILCRGPAITCRELPAEISMPALDGSSLATATFHETKDRVVEEFERTFLTSMLSVCGGIVSRAAERCGLSERNFHAKLKKYGIQSKACRA